MDNKPVAVVTGANRGIGYEVSKQLAALGYAIVLTARSEAKGLAAAEEIQKEGYEVAFVQMDVESSKSIQKAVKKIKELYGKVHVLVNNAGSILDSGSVASEESPTLKTKPAVIKDSFKLNTVSALQVTQEIVPLMTEGGNIVNVSSGMGGLTEMGTGYPGYRMSKAALNALTKILSQELAPKGIKVNSVCPGWVRTELGGENATRSIPEGAQGIVYAATVGEEGPTGQFLRDGYPIAW